jgi:hypothetical protein
VQLWTGSETAPLPPGQLRGEPASDALHRRPWIALSLPALRRSSTAAPLTDRLADESIID